MIKLIAVQRAVAVVLLAFPAAAAQAQSSVPAPSAVAIPQADRACLLPGNRLNLQCIVAHDPDVQRIRAEEAQLEDQALATAQSGTLDPFHRVETLGELEIFDSTLSVNNNVACSFCHDPAAGYRNGISILSQFAGGTNGGSVAITVPGAYPNTRIAKRNPQSYAYAPYFPPLQYNATQGDFDGGNFWDARATGFRLQNSAAEQAQDPPVDPEEMANPDTACVVWKLSRGRYKFFFEQVWGTGALDIAWPGDVATV
jgi:cytochrome c peroxidase